MQAELPLVFYAVAAFAVVFVGLAKAGFGGAVGSVAVPMVAAASDILTAVAVLLPIYIIMDLTLTWVCRRDVAVQLFRPMVLAGLLGVAIGGLAFRSIEPRLLQAVLGLLSAGSAVRFAMAGRGGATPPALPMQGASVRRRAAGWGGAGGFLSFFLMGEAPAQIFLLPYRLAPAVYVASMIWFFAAVNVAKLPILLGLGMVNTDTLALSALFLPLLPVGLILGRWINTRIAPGPFYAVAHGLLFVLGVYLIVRALAG